ncbi:hypothetical protein CH75_03140 [Dyella jiangningensis]|nr:hypothetical protein CH75_03140 [Dyella jiangningensis]
MKKILLALACAAFVAPIASQASQSNDISYNYVQLDYANVSQSGHGFVADGGALTGSYSFADHYQVFAGYSDLRTDKERYSIDGLGGYTFSEQAKSRPWTLGAGYFTAISNRTDWVTQLSYTRERLSDRFCLEGYRCQSFDDHYNVWTVNSGVMGHLTDHLIANAYLGYSNGGRGVEGNFFGDFGLLYTFNKTWALNGGVRVNNNSTETFTLGVRASF